MTAQSSLPSTSLAGLVLAAGESRRFGRPKQLAEWNGKALLGRAIEAMVPVCGAEIIVVTGAAAGPVGTHAAAYPVRLVHNPEWREGMAASLRAGFSALENSGVEAVLVFTCDQPLVDAARLESLVKLWKTDPARPAAARYNGILGIPAIFPLSLLPELLRLRGEKGARALLNEQLDPLAVDMPVAACDIDTEADLAKLGTEAGAARGSENPAARN